MESNIDQAVVEGFGDEWSRFDQSELSPEEELAMFNDHFCIFPWDVLPANSIGFDLGCGSGRWAKLLAPRVGELHCIDPSAAALEVAKKNLVGQQNCQFHLASVDTIPLNNESADFGYAIGVLHHIPDTQMGIKSCVAKLKQKSPFLLYLYYAFDNRPWWFRLIWKVSEMGRFILSRSPAPIRYFLSQVIALFIYLPLARFSVILEKIGIDVDSVPLSYYKDKSFYTMQTDALDRFGTKLEKRFTKNQILKMMESAGLEKIAFSDRAPYWCAVGYKK
ncbi:class I SAM-dependent methyltransferase [Funiculus sociatus GB2-A5]|uniref:Class I SAM-dependent methyltransferase n=1 Tax=Funiculus sociatus GB2-A5 TaxID=2933946 RepID=A0ABV0JQP6_9CYAN|nr:MULTISPECIES: class I SAM-dependent methyltransferase [unclassified Trichocoleus]MBD1906691.1 class I SAM-dependent methyltransferase [Trichocoleus sp. FACHB-832]MBD2063128.1 class I SAM-dependent methyltransferase [Trichocoleus sp. FACHB-6]